MNDVAARAIFSSALLAAEAGHAVRRAMRLDAGVLWEIGVSSNAIKLSPIYMKML